jgi:hypothetical protein
VIYFHFIPVVPRDLNLYIVRYIPEWFPGGGFKKKGREFTQDLAHFVAKPLAFTKFQKAQNTHDPSYASDLIDQEEDEDVIEWTASAMYMAGADTVRISCLATCDIIDSNILHPRLLLLSEDVY